MYQLVKKDIGRDIYWISRARGGKSRAQVLCEFKYRKDAIRVLHEVVKTVRLNKFFYTPLGYYPHLAKHYVKGSPCFISKDGSFGPVS